jgi:aerobic-type carbon monoxide dehydrogenase small subunit (CoxS/CutS family)
MKVSFRLNGGQVDVDVRSDALLVDLLRGLGLTGTKETCGVGSCGVCTVLVGSDPVSSCLYLAGCADSADVWTVEGLTDLEPALVDAFVQHEGMQCGMCTPGAVVAAYALRGQMPSAETDEVRTFMSGNLCRCTGYASILAAVKAYLDAP